MSKPKAVKVWSLTKQGRRLVDKILDIIKESEQDEST
jgi:hypothetical protein